MSTAIPALRLGRSFVILIALVGQCLIGSRTSPAVEKAIRDEVRTVLLNGVAWVAKIDIPSDGVPSAPLSKEALDALLDEVHGNKEPGVRLPVMVPGSESLSRKPS